MVLISFLKTTMKNLYQVPKNFQTEECLKKNKKLQNSPLEVVQCSPVYDKLAKAPLLLDLKNEDQWCL